MSVSFCGFNENTATFKANEEIAKGTPVKMNGSGTVAACADGEAFCGIVTECSGGYASVQLSGAVTAKYSGSVEAGYASLVCGSDGVKSGAEGREYLVVAVNEADSTVTFIM